jgi:multiple sugar transport system substrate-binding protein
MKTAAVSFMFLKKERRMKPRQWLMTLLIIVAIVAPACAPAAAPTQAPETGGEPSGKIVFAYPGEETEQVMRPVIVKMFKEKHPNIIVEEQPVPGDYDTTVLAQIAAGNPPDIFVSGDVFVAPFINDGVAADLTPFFESDPDLKETDFYPSVIDFFRGPNGHVYMMPDTLDVQRVYYNKDLFDKAGVAQPSESWTIEDFKSAAAAITSGEGPDKIYGFYADPWWAVWLPYVWMNGGDILSEDGTQCTLAEPAAVEALDWYGDFIRQGYSPSPQELEGLGMGGWDLFINGKVGMYQTGGWDIPANEAEATFQWGMAPVPKGKSEATFLHLTNYVMAANSKNKEAAWEFLKFLASPEVYNLEAAVYGWGVPPRPEVTDAFIAKPPENATPVNIENVKIGQASAPNGRLPAKILNWDEFTGDSVDIGLEPYWNGEISAEEAAKAACAAVKPEPANK